LYQKEIDFMVVNFIFSSWNSHILNALLSLH
jgi:hypothetical protein